MNIKLVKYSHIGRPYILGLVKNYFNGKKYIKYTRHIYGIVKECLTCKKLFFTRNRKDKRPQNYCSKKCIRHPNQLKHWAIGNIIKRPSGYCEIMMPSHPKSNFQGRIALHRYLMEQKSNRVLEDWEVVHHIDRNKSNNALENLMVMSSYNHAKLHLKERWIQTKCWDKNKEEGGWVKCDKTKNQNAKY